MDQGKIIDSQPSNDKSKNLEETQDSNINIKNCTNASPTLIEEIKKKIIKNHDK